MSFAMSFKDALFAAQNGRKVERVETLHGPVWVRAMTVAEKDVFDMSLVADKAGKPRNFRTQLLIAACCDESGEAVFDEFDVGRLEATLWYELEPAFEAAMELNKIGAKDAEAIRKNSDRADDAGSS